METGGDIRVPHRRDPAVGRILRDWRRLTSPARAARAGPGRDVLIACSGGADSSALAIALAATGRRFTLAHIVHDMRPRAEAMADAAAVERLAGTLGFEFACAEVSVRSAGVPRNAEAAARVLRYEALADLALDRGVRFVATGHHAEDQLETLVMGMLRGSGARGLGGIAPRRLLARDFGGERERRVYAVRPMLDVTRAESERICRDAGWAWRVDATNADTSRLRSAVRARVLPVLAEIRPGAARRAGWTAKVMRSASGLIDAAAVELCEQSAAARESDEGPLVWEREELRRQPLAVLGEALRIASAAVAGEEAGMDRIGRSRLEPVIAAIRDRGTDPRVFDWGGVVVEVTAHRVAVAKKS